MLSAGEGGEVLEEARRRSDGPFSDAALFPRESVCARAIETVCVCVYVRYRDREGGRERERECVCVCARERERESV